MIQNEDELISISDFQYQYIDPTPQIQWPKIYKRFGYKVWMKHENHTRIGSFKIRSSLNLINHEAKQNDVLCCVSNGNYGQGIAFAASALSKRSIVFCPVRTSKSKIHSIRSLGAEIKLEGEDFNETLEIASEYSKINNIKLLPSYDINLAKGCSSYSYELFSKVENIAKVYVPIGLGSGICGTIFARNILSPKTDIIGVVPKNANSYSLSFINKNVTKINKVNTFAEGTAVRVPSQEALDVILKNVSNIIEIEEEEIKDSIRFIYDDTSNIAEGSGALSYAAAFKEREKNQKKEIAVILTGGNIDRQMYSEILS